MALELLHDSEGRHFTDCCGNIKGFNIVHRHPISELPYGITQCYLVTGDCTPPEPQRGRLVLDSPAPVGWKAELTRVRGSITETSCFLMQRVSCVGLGM